MKMFSKKIAFLIILSLSISMLLSLNNLNVFAESINKKNPELLIEGILDKDSVILSSKDLSAMPMSSKTEKILRFKKINQHIKIKAEGINLAYLLKDFCRINVKEADVLLIDSKNKKTIIKKFSDLTNDKSGYYLLYKINKIKKNSDVSDLLDTNSLILVSKNEEEKADFNKFYVDTIKINASLNVKQMPKLAPEFKDIYTEYDYAKNAISELVKMDIINGISETEFAPQKPITRAFFCKIISSSLNLNKINYDSRYSDVNSSDWYSSYIASAVASGIINGYTDGTFGPNNQINRQEFATLCAEIAIKKGIIKEKEILEYTLKNSKFKDKDSVFGWIESSIAYLYSIGAYENYIKDEFFPLKSVTRGEASYIIYTLLFK